MPLSGGVGPAPDRLSAAPDHPFFVNGPLSLAGKDDSRRCDSNGENYTELDPPVGARFTAHIAEALAGVRRLPDIAAADRPSSSAARTGSTTNTRTMTPAPMAPSQAVLSTHA